MGTRTISWINITVFGAILVLCIVVSLARVGQPLFRPSVGMSINCQQKKTDGGDSGFAMGLNVGGQGVQTVMAGSPAHRAGIRIGETVLSLDGRPLSDLPALQRYLARLRPESPVTYGLQSAAGMRNVVLKPESPLGWTQTVFAVFSNLLTSLVFLVVGIVVICRRRDDLRVLLLFVVCTCAAAMYLLYPCIYSVFSGPYGIPEYASSEFLRYLPLLLVFVTAIPTSVALLHLACIFPNRLKLVARHPSAIRWAYLIMPAIFVAAMLFGFFFALCMQFPKLLTAASVGAAMLLTAALACWSARKIRNWKGLWDMVLDHPWKVVGTGLVLTCFAGVSAAAGSQWLSLPPQLAGMLGMVMFMAGMLIPMSYPLATCFALIMQYRQAGPEDRMQARWPLWGTFVAISGSMLMGLAWVGLMVLGELHPGAVFTLELLGKALYILIPVSFAIGILKHRVLDITILIRKTLVYSVVTFAALVVFFVLSGGVGALLARFTGIQSTWSIVASTLCAVALISPVHTWAQSFLDRRFFRGRYVHPVKLADLEKTLQDASERQMVNRVLLKSVAAEAPLPHCAVFIRGAADGVFRAVEKSGDLVTEYLDKRRMEACCGRWQESPGHSPECNVTGETGETLSVIAWLTVGGMPAGCLAHVRSASVAGPDDDALAYARRAAELASRALDRIKLREQNQDLERALEIQKNLLPQNTPVVSGIRIASFWQPSRAVGGDLFDLLDNGSDQVTFTIADVAGKGLSAALIMSNMQAAFRTAAEPGVPPDEVCRKLNRSASSLLGAGRFVTFFQGNYDSSTMTLQYCNAGHCAPVLLRRDGSTERLEEGGLILGVFPEATYERLSTRFAPGDRLVLFTDGVTEAVSAEGEEFGEQRLVEFCRDEKETDPDRMIRKLMHAVEAHCAGDFHDDVTILAVFAGELS